MSKLTGSPALGRKVPPGKKASFVIVSDIKASTRMLTKATTEVNTKLRSVWHKISHLPEGTKAKVIADILGQLETFSATLEENRDLMLKSVKMAKSAADHVTTEEDEPEMGHHVVEMEHAQPNYNLEDENLSGTDAFTRNGGRAGSPKTGRKAVGSPKAGRNSKPASQSPVAIRASGASGPRAGGRGGHRRSMSAGSSALAQSMSAGSSALAQPKLKAKSALGTSSASAGNAGMGSESTGISAVAQRMAGTPPGPGANAADAGEAFAVPPMRQRTTDESAITHKPEEPAQAKAPPAPAAAEAKPPAATAGSSDKEAAAAKARAALAKMVGASPASNGRTAPSFKAVVETVIEEQQKASPKTTPAKTGFADAAQEAMRKKKAKREAAERAAAFDSIAAAAKAADAEAMNAEAAARAAALRKNPWAAVGTPPSELNASSGVSPQPPAQ